MFITYFHHHRFCNTAPVLTEINGGGGGGGDFHGGGMDIFWENKVLSHNSLKYMFFHRGGDSTATHSYLGIFIS